MTEAAPAEKLPWWKRKWVWATVAVLIVIGAIAGGGNDDKDVEGTVAATAVTTAPPSTRATTLPPITLPATTVQPSAPVTTPPPVDWTAKVKETAGSDGGLISSAKVIGPSLSITTLRYKDSDALVEGWAATICFAAQDAGWATDIEVLDANGRALAGTFSKPGGRYMCMGQTFGTS